MTGVLTLVRQNWMLAVFAILLSWMVWVMFGPMIVETKTMTIEVKILPDPGREDVIIVLDHRPLTVEVEISGTRRVIDRLDSEDLPAIFRVRAEFLGESGSAQTRTFTAKDLEMPRDVELLGMKPSRVTATFARRGSARVDVKVLTDETGLEEQGVRLVRAVAIPARIDIEGPQQLVQRVVDVDKGIETTRIDVRAIAPTAAGQTEVTEVITLDLEKLESSGLRTRVREATVLLQFEHVYRIEDFWVPLAMHWVDPDPETNPQPYKINASRGVQEDRSNWKVRVTLVGPKAVLENAEAIGQIRAHVRSDEAKRAIEAKLNNPRIHFDFLPEGVRVEGAPPADVSAQTEFVIRKKDE